MKKHLTRTVAALLFAVSLTLMNESGNPDIINLLCFAAFVLVARYADRKGHLNESDEA